MMREFFQSEAADGVLLIDADNAFNRVNRAAALWNIQFVCPVLKFSVINVQSSESDFCGG